MTEAEDIHFRAAVRHDVSAIVRRLADDPLPACYLEAFDAIDRARQRGCHRVIAFYRALGDALEARASLGKRLG